MANSGPQDKAGKREAILEAALGLFVELGFHGTPVPLVAEKAGVGAGTIYRYFESKEALVNALYQKWKGLLGSALLEGFPFDKPPREQFRFYARRMAGFARQHPREVAFLELHHHAPYLDDASRAIEATIMDAARAFFETARAAQVTKDLAPDVLIALVNGAFTGLLKASLAGQVALDDAIVDAAERCLWEAIRR